VKLWPLSVQLFGSVLVVFFLNGLVMPMSLEVQYYYEAIRSATFPPYSLPFLVKLPLWLGFTLYGLLTLGIPSLVVSVCLALVIAWSVHRVLKLSRLWALVGGTLAGVIAATLGLWALPEDFLYSFGQPRWGAIGFVVVAEVVIYALLGWSLHRVFSQRPTVASR